MKKERITIGTLFVPTDTNRIAMNEYEIAELFHVIAPTVRAAIKAVYKNGIEVYGFEMIIALAFRIDSSGANKVREHLFRILRTNGKRSSVHILLPCSSNAEVIPPN